MRQTTITFVRKISRVFQELFTPLRIALNKVKGSLLKSPLMEMTEMEPMQTLTLQLVLLLNLPQSEQAH